MVVRGRAGVERAAQQQSEPAGEQQLAWARGVPARRQKTSSGRPSPMRMISGCESAVSIDRIWWAMNGGRPPLMSLIWTRPVRRERVQPREHGDDRLRRRDVVEHVLERSEVPDRSSGRSRARRRPRAVAPARSTLPTEDEQDGQEHDQRPLLARDRQSGEQAGGERSVLERRDRAPQSRARR